MSVKYRSTLSNYAMEIAPDSIDPVADFLSPRCLTGGIYAGQYKDFGDKQAYQAPNALRGIGQPASRLAFDVQDKTFALQTFGLDIPIDDQERKQASLLDPVMLERQKVKYLVRSGNNTHTKAVIAQAATQAYNATYAIDCTNASISPTDQIDNAIHFLADKVGQLPNRLLWSVGAFNAIRHHAKVVTRLQGVSIAGVTVDMIRSMLLNPNIEIMTSAFVLDASGLGAVSNKANALGYDVYLFYANPNPTPFDMSFMKTFSLTEVGMNGVYEYREDSSRSDVYALDWWEQTLITGSSLCVRMQVTPGTDA